MTDATRARGGIGITAWRFFQHLHKVLVVLGRETGVDGDDVRRRCDIDHRREISCCVIRHLGVDGWISRCGGDCGHAQRVTIGHCLGGLIGADHAAAAGLVLDDHVLPERLPQGFRDHAGHDISGSAWRERDLQLHHPIGIALGQRGASKSKKTTGYKGSTVHHEGNLLKNKSKTRSASLLTGSQTE